MGNTIEPHTSMVVQKDRDEGIVFQIQPLNILERIADMVMLPVMYLVSGVFREIPQRTHKWNRRHLSSHEVNHLDIHMMITVEGVSSDLPSSDGVRFHMPIIGGWKDYVVLTPPHPEYGWYVGWCNEKDAGVSRILLKEPVRLLIGPYDTSFFAISVEGKQLSVSKIGNGSIGDHSVFAQKYLLL